ncbi:hypothetical protein SRHO_G00133480 [Serrasalmus rhombeus]
MMRREWSSLRFRGPKAKAPPIPRALSFLSMSSLSQRARQRFPRYRQQLDPEEDFDEWVYTPFRHRGEQDRQWIGAYYE